MSALGSGCEPGSPQYPKWTVCALGGARDRRIFGRLSAGTLAKWLRQARRLAYFRAIEHSPGVDASPWVPHVLPFQVLRVGEFAAGLIPFEPTTVAGRRLRAGLLGTLEASGVETTVLVGYCNAHASYLATPEEYDAQAYEAASTLFGRATLPVVDGLLRDVARALAAGEGRTHLGDERPLAVEFPSVDTPAGRRAAGLEGPGSSCRPRPRARASMLPFRG